MAVWLLKNIISIPRHPKRDQLGSCCYDFPHVVSRHDVPTESLIFTTSSAKQTCWMSSPPNRDLQMWNCGSFKRGNFGQLCLGILGLNPESPRMYETLENLKDQLLNWSAGFQLLIAQWYNQRSYNFTAHKIWCFLTSIPGLLGKIRKGSGWGVPWRSSSNHCLTSPFRHTKLQGDNTAFPRWGFLQLDLNQLSWFDSSSVDLDKIKVHSLYFVDCFTGERGYWSWSIQTHVIIHIYIYINILCMWW